MCRGSLSREEISVANTETGLLPKRFVRNAIMSRTSIQIYMLARNINFSQV